MNKHIVYCDMDGVLADFDLYYYQLFGKYPKDCKDDQELWGKINNYRVTTNKPWFSALPAMPDIIKLYTFLDENFNWAILTATGIDSAHAVPEKAAWAANNIGDDIEIFYVTSGKDKAKYANTNSILIDDREKAILPFRKAGGIGILHTSAQQTIKELEEILKNEESKIARIPQEPESSDIQDL